MAYRVGSIALTLAELHSSITFKFTDSLREREL